VALYADSEVPGGRNYPPVDMANVTRHGNTTNAARQQAWVLSTTDQRLTHYWHVDQPILRSDNYALCLGILPTLLDDAGILPSTRDRSMPSLYVSSVFYENAHRIRYPSAIVKTDRGEWTTTPTARDFDGNIISEPYHCETYTRATWLHYRNSASWASLTDAELQRKMLEEFKVDLETSRVWHHSCLWECLTDETSAEPGFTPQAWKMVSGKGWWVDFQLSQAPVVNLEDVSLKATPVIMLGDDDVSAQAVEQSAILAVTWTRHGNADGSQTAADALYKHVKSWYDGDVAIKKW